MFLFRETFQNLQLPVSNCANSALYKAPLVASKRILLPRLCLIFQPLAQWPQNAYCSLDSASSSNYSLHSESCPEICNSQSFSPPSFLKSMSYQPDKSSKDALQGSSKKKTLIESPVSTKSPLEDDPDARNPLVWRRGDILREIKDHSCQLMFLCLSQPNIKTWFDGLNQKNGKIALERFSFHYERIKKTSLSTSLPVEDDPDARKRKVWKRGDILREINHKNRQLMFLEFIMQDRRSFYGLHQGTGKVSKEWSIEYERIRKTDFLSTDFQFEKGDRVQLLADVDDLRIGTEFVVDIIYRNTGDCCVLFPGNYFGFVGSTSLFTKVRKSQQ